MFADIVSRIYFKKSDYDSLDDLFKDVGKQIQILTKNRDSVVFYQFQDATDIYVLEHSPMSAGDVFESPLFPSWLDSDELLAVQSARVLNRLADMNKEKEDLEKAKEDIEASLVNDTKGNKEPGGQA